MKKVFYLLLLCMCAAFGIHKVQAQEATTPETSLFKVEDNALIWQKVYDINVTPKEYLTFIRLKGSIENIDTLQNTIVGRLRKFKPNRYGLSWAETPIYLRDDATYADVRIEIKENKYRVTVYNIKMVTEMDNVVSKAGEIVGLEQYYFKPLGKKAPRPNFFKFDEPIFTKNFGSFFTYKKPSSDF